MQYFIFLGAFEPEGAIRLFFTGSGFGLRKTKNSELRASGEKV
jgi:hypothetical protein